MGVCFSKKKKKSKDSVGNGEKSKPIEDCRDPPPTESPQEEEKVKEVLSETPNLAAVRSKDDEIVKRRRSRGNDDGEEKEEESEVNGDATPTPSESTTTATTVAFTEQSKAGDEEEEEVEMFEKKKTRSRSRSQSPAKVVHKRTSSRSSDYRDLPVTVASASKKREMRAVDVGCRTSRSTPSPLKNRSISSKREIGERSGRRSASPAANNNKMRSFCAAEPATMMKGRSSPQRRVPAARAGGLVGPSLRGRDGNNAPTSEAEESLENPLVSMECFIFL